MKEPISFDSERLSARWHDSREAGTQGAGAALLEPVQGRSRRLAQRARSIGRSAACVGVLLVLGACGDRRIVFCDPALPENLGGCGLEGVGGTGGAASGGAGGSVSGGSGGSGGSVALGG